jgi:hypothetical protein
MSTGRGGGGGFRVISITHALGAVPAAPPRRNISYMVIRKFCSSRFATRIDLKSRINLW